ncbi:hypothetical protein Pcinc_025846 [Petrolisthes cinctipes]|uniref:Uncharacterized protein n=1 Tax=Petrolisthes cinctipes TaxID=88211 RepID=A0AAE1KCG9_PETCI|nr:hypothetical protein Pcinc_025846 [Petrolisthes cinctipes]
MVTVNYIYGPHHLNLTVSIPHNQRIFCLKSCFGSISCIKSNIAPIRSAATVIVDSDTKNHFKTLKNGVDSQELLPTGQMRGPSAGRHGMGTSSSMGPFVLKSSPNGSKVCPRDGAETNISWPKHPINQHRTTPRGRSLWRAALLARIGSLLHGNHLVWSLTGDLSSMGSPLSPKSGQHRGRSPL